jgi:glycosyltransferase involved in cell wall biosynthesis
MKLTAVMMTFNEAQFLPHTLPSLLEVADEVIVLDMGSSDGTQRILADALGPTDLLLSYPRRNLFSFGFSHPRNYAIAHAKCPWVLAIDADELVEADELRRAITLLSAEFDVFDVERRNYEGVEGRSIEDARSNMVDTPFTTERHRRLFRNLDEIRFEGVIHEEVWNGAKSSFFGSGSLPIILHHLSAYRTGSDGHEKQELYAHLLIKALMYPRFRYGTNPWFFTTYVPENLNVLYHQAASFALRHGLTSYDLVQLERIAEEEQRRRLQP